MTNKHRHSWKPLYRCGYREIGFSCSCGEQRARPLTKEEIKLCKAEDNKPSKIHKIFHDYLSKCCTKKLKKKDKGYDFYKQVAAWAKKHPTVIITNCDDNYYAGSELVFIPHESREEGYFGTSVIYIPQCTGESPIRFFLYPEHLSNLLTVLKIIHRRSKANPLKDEKSVWDKFKLIEPRKIKRKNRP